MDPNLLKNLGLDSSLNQNDMQLLNQILTSMGPGGNKKAPKMTAKDRNNLIAKLSSNETLSQIPKKELKDMNEQEKKIYREELKQKLKNKQNQLKMERTNNVNKNKMINNDNNYTNAIGKLTELMKNMDTSTLETLNSNKIDNGVQKESDLMKQTNTKQETLINNIIIDTNNDKTGEPDNLDDYLN